MTPVTPTRPQKERSSVLSAVYSGWGPPLLVFVGFIGLWYLFSLVVLEPHRRIFLPPPHEVVADSLDDAATRNELFDAFVSTARTSMVGLGVAIVIGVAVATLMSQAKWVERALFPYAVILQTIPILAITPLIGLFFGDDLLGRVIICVIISLFPIITNTLFGLLSVPRDYHDLFTLHGAGRYQRLSRLQFPAALPAMFTGFRISAGLSVIGAIIAELLFRAGGADKGLGGQLETYRQQGAYEELWGSLALSSLLGVLVFWGATWLANRVVGRWAPL